MAIVFRQFQSLSLGNLGLNFLHINEVFAAFDGTGIVPDWLCAGRVNSAHHVRYESVLPKRLFPGQ
jgi:hypothetical protein